jgi:hypothetical protein
MKLLEFRHLNENDTSKLIIRLRGNLSGLPKTILGMIDFYNLNAITPKQIKETIIDIASEDLVTSRSFPHFQSEEKVIDFYMTHSDEIDDMLRSIEWFDEKANVKSVREYIVNSTRTAVSNAILEIRELINQ